MKKDIFILGARRTAVASPFKGLKEYTAAQMAGVVVKELLSGPEFAGIKIDECVFGNAVSAGTGQNLARQIGALAGVPLQTPAYTVNAVCGSGLQAVILACRSILAGESRAVVAGGTESATFSPDLVGKEGSDFAEKHDSIFHDGLLCAITDKAMGELCERLAAENEISREEQDFFANESHQKACAARDAGQFKEEIVPLANSGGPFDQDERPRQKMSLERLADLPPAFSEDGTITAGNSSAPADGACAFLLADAETLRGKKITPLARVIDYASVALEPQEVFTGAVKAVNEVLKKSGLTVKDIDLFEVTESFAAQAIYTQRKLRIPDKKMNAFGGDVALGHPLGTAGARALVTLVHGLRARKKRLGLASVCFGGGGAIAMVVENSQCAQDERKK